MIKFILSHPHALVQAISVGISLLSASITVFTLYMVMQTNAELKK